MGTLGIGLPAIIASGIFDSATLTKTLAISASFVSRLQSFLRCDWRASGLHAAWRHLRAAQLKYVYVDEYEIADVIDAYDRGEQLIENIFTPTDNETEKKTQPN